MRGNRPKSYALCQTRVCLAVAAAAVAIGLPPPTSAAVPLDKSIKEERLEQLNTLVDQSGVDLEKKKLDNLDKRFIVEAGLPLHEPLSDLTDDVELKKVLSKASAELQEKLEALATEIGEGVPTPSQEYRRNELSALKDKVDELNGTSTPTTAPEKADLLAELRKAGAAWTASSDELTAAEHLHDSLSYKKDRWEQVPEGAEAERLAKTRELSPRDTSDPGQRSTWNDKNLIDFMADADRLPDGESLIHKDTTLEISRRSGFESDAIEGVPNRVREVGLIRAMDGALHTVYVDNGLLNVYEGIDGKGRLGVDVGTNGALNFKGGPGIDKDATNVSLVAGLSDGDQPADDKKGGVIEFGEGTSSGGATIDVRDKGQVRFLKDTNAGTSQIAIESGGYGLFDKGASAANAKIRNQDHLEFVGAKGGDAQVDNDVRGTVTLEDTELERMNIVSRGMVDMSGKTTADNAAVALDGGYLNVTEIKVSDAKADASAPTLTLGSLTGKGRVGTGNTWLRIGALGRDETFAGEIGKDVLGTSGANVTKVGTGNLTFSGDQSGIDSLTVENGTLTAAHRNALGTGLLALRAPGTISLANDVYDVRKFENAGTLKLHGYRIVMDEYESKGKDARIESDAKRDPNAPDEVHRGTIHIKKKGDFTDTKIVLTPDGSVTAKELLDKKIQVVTHDPDADVKLGEVDYGSIPTEPGEGGGDGGEGDGDVVIDPNKEIAFLDPHAPYTGNEKGLLDSLQGLTLNPIIEGRVGGAVLGQLVLLPAGSAEQRRAARMLSGESLANNADAAYSASDAFRSSMQTRMLAGGSLPDCNATNGQSAGQNGMLVWGSFKGMGANRSDGEQRFSTSGIDGAFGVDRRLNQNALVGVAFGLGSRTSRADDLPGDASIRSASVGLYGSYLSDARWFANGGLFFTNHNVTTERTVAARDVSARVAGKTSGRTLGLFGEVGQRVLAGGMNVDPFIGMRIASTRLNGYDETDRDAGQGNNGLHVGSQVSNSRRAILGLRLWRELVNTSGGSVIPSLRLAYEHEFGDTQSSLTNAIYGAPRAFTVKGVKLGRDIFTADLGADVRVTRQLNVHVGGNLSLRSGEKAIAGGVTAKYMF